MVNILRLKKPLTRIVPTQLFGANDCCWNRITNALVAKKLTGECPTGFESIYEASGMKGHNGVDMGCATGTPIFACYDGIVCEIETEPSRGLGIGIVTYEKVFWGLDQPYYAKLRYWHLKTILVKMGQSVKQGQIIGEADNTGYSTGSHLHLELKPVLYDKNNKMYNVFQDNGYLGAKNPIAFMYDLTGMDLIDYQARLRGLIYTWLNKIRSLIT